jgi:hypothetical protein
MYLFCKRHTNIYLTVTVAVALQVNSNNCATSYFEFECYIYV